MTKKKSAWAAPAPSIPATLMSASSTALPLMATGLLTSAVTLFLVSSFLSPLASSSPIAVFDVDMAMAQFVALPEIENLGSDQEGFTQAVKDFHAALDAEMQAYAKASGQLLLSDAAVLAGSAPNVTATLFDRAVHALQSNAGN